MTGFYGISSYHGNWDLVYFGLFSFTFTVQIWHRYVENHSCNGWFSLFLTFFLTAVALKINRHSPSSNLTFRSWLYTIWSNFIKSDADKATHKQTETHIHTQTYKSDHNTDYDSAGERIAEAYNNAIAKSADQPIFILGDFNQCKLPKYLPGLHQYVTVKARLNSTLDKCFGNIENAYISKSRPALGRSDHNVIHLLPKYKQRIKTERPKTGNRNNV